jgi:hypothetical protein
MRLARPLLTDTLVTGAVTAVATLAVPSLIRSSRGLSPLPPFNSVSHMVWGDGAFRRDGASAKYTGVGLALHVGACVFWAAVYETWMHRRAGMSAEERDRSEPPAGSRDRAPPPGSAAGAEIRAGEAIAVGAATAVAAYVTDYYVVPRRLSPGFEQRFSPAELLAVYVALGLSFPLWRLARRALRGGR